MLSSSLFQHDLATDKGVNDLGHSRILNRLPFPRLPSFVLCHFGVWFVLLLQGTIEDVRRQVNEVLASRDVSLTVPRDLMLTG